MTKTEKRLAALLPGGVPKYVRCYDNGGMDAKNGKGSADRYTVVFTGRYTHKTLGSTLYLAMNREPFHPQGIGMHGESTDPIDRPRYGHLGKRIKFADLPEDCRKLVMSDYLELWDLPKPAPVAMKA